MDQSQKPHVSPMRTFSKEPVKQPVVAKNLTIKEILENSENGLDFIENSESTATYKNSNLSSSNTSSEKNFAEIEEESVSFENIDLPIEVSTKLDKDAPELQVTEDSTKIQSEETVTKSTTTRLIKTILKPANRPPGDRFKDSVTLLVPNVSRKENPKCRSVLDEEINQNSKKNWNFVEIF